MRAAVYRDGQISAETMPDPMPGAGQVLVKTLRCGICGSDLHVAKFPSQFSALGKRSAERLGMIRRAGWCSGTSFVARSSIMDRARRSSSNRVRWWSQCR